jgi:hypothetical protein
MSEGESKAFVLSFYRKKIWNTLKVANYKAGIVVYSYFIMVLIKTKSEKWF